MKIVILFQYTDKLNWQERQACDQQCWPVGWAWTLSWSSSVCCGAIGTNFMTWREGCSPRPFTQPCYKTQCRAQGAEEDRKHGQREGAVCRVYRSLWGAGRRAKHHPAEDEAFRWLGMQAKGWRKGAPMLSHTSLITAQGRSDPSWWWAWAVPQAHPAGSQTLLRRVVPGFAWKGSDL